MAIKNRDGERELGGRFLIFFFMYFCIFSLIAGSMDCCYFFKGNLVKENRQENYTRSHQRDSKVGKSMKLGSKSVDRREAYIGPHVHSLPTQDQRTLRY